MADKRESRDAGVEADDPLTELLRQGAESAPHDDAGEWLRRLREEGEAASSDPPNKVDAGRS
jgi:hypothetical protein